MVYYRVEVYLAKTWGRQVFEEFHFASRWDAVDYASLLRSRLEDIGNPDGLVVGIYEQVE